MSLVLGLETSCDETSAAVVRDGRDVLSSIVASQVALHRLYGGVVPELASRQHLEAFLPAVDRALKEAGVAPADLDAVAVTTGPGLAGALVVGLSAASALALAWGKPLVPTNHLEAHAYAAFLRPPGVPGGGPGAPGGTGPRPPMIVLIVSGGHTSLARLVEHVRFEPLGETRDDAAGEAFDKVARHLGLGYPGGPVIDRLAAAGDPEAVPFPRAFLPGTLDFSFSGVKTAVLYYAEAAKRRGEPLNLENVAASFQTAIVDVLVQKAFAALSRTGLTRLAVVGGVAANRGLRRALAARAESEGIDLVLPPVEYCTDNAAMVAGLAHFLMASGAAREAGPAIPASAEAAGGAPLGGLRIQPTAGLGGRDRRRGRQAARDSTASGKGPQGTTVRRGDGNPNGGKA